eukprot:scaffold33198_cov107-Isochrysis_galbana.AAC.2
MHPSPPVPRTGAGADQAARAAPIGWTDACGITRKMGQREGKFVRERRRAAHGDVVAGAPAPRHA